MNEGVINWALDHLGTIVVCAVAFYAGTVLGGVGNHPPPQQVVEHHDDTDPPNGLSGMKLFTDALTGCQYLGGDDRGPSVARTDITGKQVGCRPYVGK